MTPFERWQQIKEVLATALDLSAVEREEYLVKTCAGDAEMLGEVAELIVPTRTPENLLGTPAGGSKRSLIRDAEPESYVGRRLGPYEIVEIIGEGGMGAVYRALRVDDVYQKQVAIKVVKHGMDSDFILRRFRNERQIMANLEHPNIARLLDGGATEDGCPTSSWSTFRASRSISTATHGGSAPRAGCGLQNVCAAVHFAHQRMIVHRDIKPGNILVTPEGEPKLVDFGIAKILNREFSTHSLDPTLTVMRMMIRNTPARSRFAATRSRPRATPIRWACCCTNCSPATVPTA